MDMEISAGQQIDSFNRVDGSRAVEALCNTRSLANIYWTRQAAQESVLTFLQVFVTRNDQQPMDSDDAFSNFEDEIKRRKVKVEVQTTSWLANSMLLDFMIASQLRKTL